MDSVEVAHPNQQPQVLEIEDSEDEIAGNGETINIPDEKQKLKIKGDKRTRVLSPTPQDAPALMLFSPQPISLISPRATSPQKKDNLSLTMTLTRKLGKLISAQKEAGASADMSASPQAGEPELSPNLAPSPEVGRFQSVWKFDEAGKLCSSEEASKDSVKEVDVIEYIKSGSILLKFGARGNPHFRFFAVNSKLDTLLWMSGSKMLELTQIPVVSISDIKFGLGDKALRIKGAKQYQDLGFTIVYDDYQKTLELLAKDTEELQIWITALIVLHNACKERKPAPQDWKVPIMTATSRSIIFGKAASSVQKAKKEISSLTKKFKDLTAESERVVVPFADDMLVRVRSILEACKSEESNLIYLSWSLKIHIEAIEHMMSTPRSL
jgi:hypothetical protein